jgi:hypothetical protein
MQHDLYLTISLLLYLHCLFLLTWLYPLADLVWLGDMAYSHLMKSFCLVLSTHKSQRNRRVHTACILFCSLPPNYDLQLLMCYLTLYLQFCIFDVQAVIKMDDGGSFYINNTGKFSIFVNSKEVPCSKRINLMSDSLIEV